MVDTAQFIEEEKQRVALLEQASAIVRAAEAQGRPPTDAEDARVLELMRRVRALEEQIAHFRRHRAWSPSAWR